MTKPINTSGIGNRFQKGVSGNPGGRPKIKPFTELLREALAEKDQMTGRTKLEAIARRLRQAGGPVRRLSMATEVSAIVGIQFSLADGLRRFGDQPLS